MVKKGTAIIIGGGASGLMAANYLASHGEKVILIEKKHQLGLKLRITGKGRCNLTNSCNKTEYLQHISSPEFFSHAFDGFDNKDLMAFFEEKGVDLTVERGQRVFPLSGRANDIFFALLEGIEHNPNVEIIKNCEVKHLIVENNKASGVVAQGRKIQSDNVIIATGGKTYPSTGAEGDGYRILKLLGHDIVKPLPMLVGLRTENGYPKQLQDFEVKNCQVNIFDENKNIIESLFGDIYLDEYGVSGPVILTLSRKIMREFDKGKAMFLNIDFKPKVSKEKLYDEILETFRTRRTENASSVVRKWVQKPMVEDVLECCNINPKTMAYKLSEKDAKSLLWYLKFRKNEIIGDMGWNEAIITGGGVSLKQVNCLTMESKKVNNLYITGELLDLDADTGGYNLQIAFSTGVLAGKSIVKKNDFQGRY